MQDIVTLWHTLAGDLRNVHLLPCVIMVVIVGNASSFISFSSASFHLVSLSVFAFLQQIAEDIFAKAFLFAFCGKS